MDRDLIKQAAVAIRSLSMDVAEELFGQTQAAGATLSERLQLAEDLVVLARAEQVILSLDDARRWPSAASGPTL